MKLQIKNNKSTGLTKLDMLMWAIIALLILGGVIANIYFSSIALSIRLIGWLVIACIIAFLAFQTQFGLASWEFISQARMEMRKVVWPSRQETVQTTLIVAGMVLLMSLILWGIDSLLLWAVGTLTG